MTRPEVGPETTGTGIATILILLLQTPIHLTRAMMSSIWYPGWTKSPAEARDAEKLYTLMEFMLKGMRAPSMRKERKTPVTRVTTDKESRFLRKEQIGKSLLASLSSLYQL